MDKMTNAARTVAEKLHCTTSAARIRIGEALQTITCICEKSAADLRLLCENCEPAELPETEGVTKETPPVKKKTAKKK